METQDFTATDLTTGEKFEILEIRDTSGLTPVYAKQSFISRMFRLPKKILNYRKYNGVFITLR